MTRQGGEYYWPLAVQTAWEARVARRANNNREDT